MAVNQNFKESTVSTTNHTQNYDLPLWIDGDKTSWLTQVNDAMNKIDSGMVDAKSKALEVVGIAADAKKLADETAAESKASAEIVAGYNDRLTAVEETSAEHTDDITALNTRCDQMDTEIHSLKETQKKTTEDLGTLADQVKHNKEDADNTAQAVTTLNGTVVELTGRVTTCEEEIEALQTAQGSQGENITNLTQEVDTLKTTVDGHTTSINNLSQRVAKNESDISKTNTNLTNLSTNVESEISGLDTRVTALESGGSGSSDTVILRNGLVKASTTLGAISSSLMSVAGRTVMFSIQFSFSSSISAGTWSFALDDSGTFNEKLIELFGENYSLWGAFADIEATANHSEVAHGYIERYVDSSGNTTFRLIVNADSALGANLQLAIRCMAVVGNGLG